MTPREMTTALVIMADGPHTDDHTAAAAGLAADAIRYLNYATRCHTSAGLTEPATACAAVGSLALAASRLGQCFAQVTDFLDRELAAGRLGDDSGCHPSLPVERARRRFEYAEQAARALDNALTAAQQDLAGLHQRAGGAR